MSMTLKVGAERSRNWSMFEADIPPGFDVGAHLHGEAEEVFYILEGELDLLAFEPRNRAAGDWRTPVLAGRRSRVLVLGPPGRCPTPGPPAPPTGFYRRLNIDRSAPLVLA